jgi:hypothetical protein
MTLSPTLGIVKMGRSEPKMYLVLKKILETWMLT